MLPTHPGVRETIICQERCPLFRSLCPPTAELPEPWRVVIAGEGCVRADGETPAARYRHLARECQAAANTTPRGEDRTALLERALVWHRLADDYADSTMSLLSPVEGERPAIQQQQHVQPKDEDK